MILFYIAILLFAISVARSMGAKDFAGSIGSILGIIAIVALFTS